MSRSWIVRRRRELQRLDGHSFEPAYWLARYERSNARRPFPRDLDVAPHQIIARAIAARSLWLRLTDRILLGSGNRHDRFVHDRMFRLANGESVSRLFRVLALKKGRRYYEALFHGKRL